jgi:hypothetical protein
MTKLSTIPDHLNGEKIVQITSHKHFLWWNINCAYNGRAILSFRHVAVRL